MDAGEQAEPRAVPRPSSGHAVQLEAAEHRRVEAKDAELDHVIGSSRPSRNATMSFTAPSMSSRFTQPTAEWM